MKGLKAKRNETKIRNDYERTMRVMNVKMKIERKIGLINYSKNIFHF